MDYCNRLRKRACTDALPRLPQLVRSGSSPARRGRLSYALQSRSAADEDRSLSLRDLPRSFFARDESSRRSQATLMTTFPVF
jgi:hypothetical protein